MEQPQNQNGIVWCNYNGTQMELLGAPVQLELGNDICRQLNQQVQIQYGNFPTIQTNSSSQPHIIVTHPANANQDASGEALSTDASTILHEDQVAADDAAVATPVMLVRAASKPTRGRGGAAGERVPCSRCNKTFSCNANLRDHMRLHTGERPFTCSECGMAFAQRSNWRLHMRTHTGERPYMCGVCGKTFARSSHLPGHMRTHTGERPFPCDMCDNTFASAQALKNHARTHTGEKPFVCESCGTPFTHSSSLSSHKKRCDGEKRKRGRPLGSGQVAVKRKKGAQARRGAGGAGLGRLGRPLKGSRRRGRKAAKSTPAASESDFDQEEVKPRVLRTKKGSENPPENGVAPMTPPKATTVIKFESGLPIPSPIKGEGGFDNVSAMVDEDAEVGVSSVNDLVERGQQVLEISLEAMEGGHKGLFATTSKVKSEVEEHFFVEANENEDLSILPDDGRQLLTKDMMQEAAAAAGLGGVSLEGQDQHQEAAVTMATLHHGAVNLVHGSVGGGETENASNEEPTHQKAPLW